MNKRRDWEAIALYAGLIPVLVLRQIGLRYWGTDQEASQVALFISFFCVGAIHAVRHFRSKGLLLTFGVVGMWWGTEYVGVTTGWIFGRYDYRAILGPSILQVPVIIPLVWFTMFYGARWTARYCLGPDECDVAFGGQSAAGLTTLVTASLMTLWDLAMDFAQVKEGQWVWHEPGWWFGIPLHNFIGWFGGTVVIQVVLSALIRDLKPLNIRQVGPAIVFYLVIVLLADLKALAYGEPVLALLVGVPWLLVTGCVVRKAIRRTR